MSNPVAAGLIWVHCQNVTLSWNPNTIDYKHLPSAGDFFPLLHTGHCWTFVTSRSKLDILHDVTKWANNEKGFVYHHTTTLNSQMPKAKTQKLVFSCCYLPKAFCRFRENWIIPNHPKLDFYWLLQEKPVDRRPAHCCFGFWWPVCIFALLLSITVHSVHFLGLRIFLKGHTFCGGLLWGKK